jgi:hypothetical protein
MSKVNPFQLIYKVEAEKLEKVVSLAWEVIANTGMEPESINLPDGRVIPWYADAAHWFAAEGRIDEKEFIEMSLTKK